MSLLRAIRLLATLYLAALVLLVLVLHFGGDRWWWATLPLYAPRWLFALPLPLLALGVWRCLPRGSRRGTTIMLAVAALLLAFPVMSFQFPWQAWLAPKGPGHGTIRVLTANVEREALQGARLAQIIEREKPDIVALQEWSDETAMSWPAGWRVIRPGPELLIASRLPFDEAAVARWGDPDSLQVINHALAIFTTPFGPVPFWSFHFESPRTGLAQIASRRTLINPAAAPALTQSLAERLAASRFAAQHVSTLCAGTEPIVVGDFNMPSDSWIFRETWGHLQSGFEVAGLGFGHTIWASIGPIAYGARIDHQLAGPHWRARGAHVGAYIGSDHRPLIVDWEYAGDVCVSHEAPPAPREFSPPAVEEYFVKPIEGALPAGWHQWRDGRLATAGVVERGPTVTQGPGYLEIRSDDSGADARAWLDRLYAGDQEVSVYVAPLSLTPVRLYLRSAHLDSRVPTGLVLEVLRGVEARLLLLTPDSTKVLGRVKSREWGDEAVRLTLSVSGKTVRARVSLANRERILDLSGEWRERTADVWTLSATDGALPDAGQVGVGRAPGYAGRMSFEKLIIGPPGTAHPMYPGKD